jgi:hypothetical protein
MDIVMSPIHSALTPFETRCGITSGTTMTFASHELVDCPECKKALIESLMRIEDAANAVLSWVIGASTRQFVDIQELHKALGQRGLGPIQTVDPGSHADP